MRFDALCKDLLFDRLLTKTMLRTMAFCEAGSHRTIKRLLLAMKLTAFLMLCFSLQVGAVGFSQTITFSAKEVPLEVAFKEIKKQSGYLVSYNASLLKRAKPVSVSVKDYPFEDFIRLILSGQNLSYVLKDKSIIITLTPDLSQGLGGSFSPALIPPPPITIRGRILNENGEPVIASVIIKGTKKGATSDAEGFFELSNVEADAILVISATNIETINASVNSQKVLNVSVTTTSTSLNEVVVNKGYYKEKQKLSTGSIVRVTSQEITRQPVTSPLLALQGRVPGLEITPQNGAPGAAPTINIRGVNSLRPGSSLPLYVIDGIIIDATPLSSTSNLYSYGRDPLENINPENIESIEVLKDADATAIYGSRGANGVILVTTKKPKNDIAKTQVQLSSYSGVGKVANFMDLLNTQQYLEMRKEAHANGGTTPASYDYDLTRWDSTRNTDWQQTLLGGTAHFSDVQGNLTITSKNTSYRLGGSYHQETSFLLRGFAHRTMTGNFSMNHISQSQKFKASLDASYGASTSNLVNSGYFVDRALTLPPNAPALYNEDGSLNWDIIDYGTFMVSALSNPLAELLKTSETDSRTLTVGSILQFAVMPGILAKVNLGYNETNQSDISKTPILSSVPIYWANSTARASFGNNERRGWMIEPQIVGFWVFGRHRLDALAGTTFQNTISQYRSFEVTEIPSDALLNSALGGPSMRIALDNYAHYRYTALYGRVGYNFDDKYLLNLTGRRDGSSRFGPGKQFGNFGAIGAAWIFSDEKILKNSTIFTFGKLRTSFGVTGNDQIGDYQYMDLYSIQGQTYQNSVALQPSALFNDQFQWEKTKKLDIALETGFFKDRIMLQASWYRNRSFNQLLPNKLPAITGFVSFFGNFPATLENSGWEFILQTNNIASKQFRWNSSINLTIPRDKLVAFPDIENSSYKTTYKLGGSISSEYGYHWKGIDPETGTHVVEDRNKDGFITLAEDGGFLPPTRQKYYGGLLNTLSYHSLTLSFLFQFSYKPFSLNSWAGTLPPGMFLGNESVEVAKWWRKPGDITNVARLTTDFSQFIPYALNVMASDYRINNASFIKLKNVLLTYNVPKLFLDKLKLRDFSISAQAQNLFTITDFIGVDPETGARSFPNLRMISLGVQAGF